MRDADNNMTPMMMELSPRTFEKLKATLQDTGITYYTYIIVTRDLARYDELLQEIKKHRLSAVVMLLPQP